MFSREKKGGGKEKKERKKRGTKNRLLICRRARFRGRLLRFWNSSDQVQEESVPCVSQAGDICRKVPQLTF